MAPPDSIPENQIKFTYLKAGICEEAPLKLKFTFDEINHPIYGKEIGLAGELPFLKSKKSLKISKYFEMTGVEQKELLDRFVKRVGHLHEELDEEELRSRYLTWIIITATSYPSSDPKTKHFESSLDFLAASFQGDDLLDEGGGLENLDLNMGLLFKRYPLWEQLFAGEYEKLGELMRILPQMEPSMTVLQECLKTMDSLVPNVRTNLVHCMQSSFRIAQGALLGLPAPGSETLSEEARKVLRALDAGGEPAIEYYAVAYNMSIPDYIRESLLFKMLRDNIMVTFGLTNDLLGLLKDVKHSETNSNFILRRVADEGLTLENSFQEALKKQINITHDINILCKKLPEAFPGEQGLADYVETCAEFHDGCLLSYLILSEKQLRYGSTKMEIVAGE